MQENEQRWFDIPTILIFLLALWIAGLRLQVTNWTEHLTNIEYALLLAALIGLVIGFSGFNSRTSRWLVIAYSVIGITWQLSLLMPAELSWSEKLLKLLQTLRLSTANFLTNQPVQGTLLFLAFMLAAFWMVGLLAGYHLTRHGRPWIPMAIIFSAFLIIDYYPPYVKSRYVFSALFVLFMLFMVGRLHYLHTQNDWKEKRALIDYGTSFDISRSMAVAGMVLVMVAWGIPGLVQLFSPGSVEQQKFVKFWEPLQERFSKALAELRSPRAAGGDFYGNSLALGTQISDQEDPVFTVEVSQERARGFNYYWRGHTYDTYRNGQWTNTIDEYKTVQPSDWPLAIPEYTAQQKVELTYLWQYSSSKILYLPGIPVEVTRPAQIRGLPTRLGDYWDGIAMYSSTNIHSGDALEAQVLVSVPTIKEMREAGVDYPAWVTDTYLQVPHEISDDISTLAEQITAGQDNVFDKTMAITRYLRNNMQYSGRVDTSPQGVDPIEYFLFDTQLGYCNYYATAEVLLLRSIGIPARMAVGFAQGEDLGEGTKFLVKLKDSHAWPEVFFPGIGWVQFEPTVIRPLPQMVLGDEEQTQNGSSSNADAPYNPDELDMFGRFERYLEEGVYGDAGYLPRLYHPWREWGVLVLVLVLLALVFRIESFRDSELYDHRLPVLMEKILHRRGWSVPSWLQYLSYRSTLSPLERNFSEIPWMLRLLGQRVSPAQTPGEQILVLKKVLPVSRDPANKLLEEYQLTIYSPHQGDINQARTAHAQLWWLVGLAWLKKTVRWKTAESSLGGAK
jgi:transglutaminase-like putative cysteine protease